MANEFDVSIVLSGGSSNINPDNSLGGEPSSMPVTDNAINNLFADITSDQSSAGFTDYRCIYFFNDGSVPMYSMEIWIEQMSSGGSNLQLGVQNSNEIQRITVSGAIVTGGSFILSYNNMPFTSTYNVDLGSWATSIQNSLNALLDGGGNHFFHGVVVTATNIDLTTIAFDCIFSGLDAQRTFDQFVLVSNNLLPNNVNVAISVIRQGSPINTIAPDINVSTTPPGGVIFSTAPQMSPITLPLLNLAEGFPLWIQRNTVAGTSALENDLLTIRLRAQSSP